MLLKLENSSKKIHNALQEDLQMVEATSCGGVVIYRGKILTLYKSYKNRYEGWVLPKGTVEEGEEYHETALREVKEEAGVQASIIKYVGKSQYSFNIQNDVVEKDVHWFLMSANSYHSRPQREARTTQQRNSYSETMNVRPYNRNLWGNRIFLK